MTELEAIERRISRRTYLPKQLDSYTAGALLTRIGEYNQKSGLSIELVRDGAKAFQGLRKSYGMFSGVHSYFALVGKRADLCLAEKSGYWGEKLVLDATMLGLGTCWVGATFDRGAAACRLKADEELVCLVAVGYCEETPGFKEGMIYRLAHRSTKSMEQMYRANGLTPPDWFLAGMQAVQRAPSALNKQPVVVDYTAERITASVADYATHQAIDLGIAKLHFEIGAGSGQWTAGNGGDYNSK